MSAGGADCSAFGLTSIGSFGFGFGSTGAGGFSGEGGFAVAGGGAIVLGRDAGRPVVGSGLTISFQHFGHGPWTPAAAAGTVKVD